MFMASKYVDIYPLLMRTVFKKIGHTKLTETSIKEKEKSMLNSFGWTIGAPTCWEIFVQMHEHCKRNLSANLEKVEEVENLTLLYMMASLYDYNIVESMTET